MVFVNLENAFDHVPREVPANMQDRTNVGHQLTGLAKRRQICQRFANVANVLPTSLQTP